MKIARPVPTSSGDCTPLTSARDIRKMDTRSEKQGMRSLQMKLFKQHPKLIIVKVNGEFGSSRKNIKVKKKTLNTQAKVKSKKDDHRVAIKDKLKTRA
ncbi:MAG: hypothetical protein ACTSXP_16115 [Promethearchaeota archaeon]